MSPLSCGDCARVVNDVLCESFTNTNVLSSFKSIIYNFVPMFPVLIDPFGIVKIIDSL